MRLERLGLENFRAFESLDLDLHPQFNVLVGTNGTGKSSVLEALAIGAGSLFLGVPGAEAPGVSRQQVRQVVYTFDGLPDLQAQYPVVIRCEGAFGDRRLSWVRTLESETGRTTRVGAESIRLVGEQLVRRVRKGEGVVLPLIAHYGTQRLWRQIKQTRGKQGVGSRFDGYMDCLEPASNHKHLTDWMRKQALAAAQRQAAIPHVGAVEAAVCACITTPEAPVEAFYFDVQHDELRVRWKSVSGEPPLIRPFALLPDGFRNMVAMVADLAWRAVVLNPHLGAGAARGTAGIVLVDEIDLHLHPSWQRRVVGDLMRVFPNVQFVVTTHSPQVIATAKPEFLRILKPDGEIARVDHVLGKDSNAVLREVMDLPDRPSWMQDKLDELARWLEAEDVPKARALLEELTRLLGPGDAALRGLEWELVDLELASAERRQEPT